MSATAKMLSPIERARLTGKAEGMLEQFIRDGGKVKDTAKLAELMVRFATEVAGR